mmetsp:Transcript_21225/g.74864  ORF Transcript_21225/g.74864 Transcript_21225/m.74864 type:complete len:82 (+) Transcript_21225:235-480(+)|eukprot:CAMPEP_0203815834 /NCGR_PEP_ID=MMETSP0115-20131106/12557_1 /ASSEMBLY_ACC=CAM_ASM_000227 /TAXON_ID=33651 /ORGANISM="Bicosoecid sp, Strain ms1" /LENGTH=81 /DNA_ID=CAMNT_0050724731 /DNA_START=232 /DNA_END=477 /DNA_ORIENTATION=-
MNALTESQQALLNQKKVELRVKNEQYLRAHPELGDMTALFLGKAVEARPDDVLAFAARFFTDKRLREATAEHGALRRHGKK